MTDALEQEQLGSAILKAVIRNDKEAVEVLVQNDDAAIGLTRLSLNLLNYCVALGIGKNPTTEQLIEFLDENIKQLVEQEIKDGNSN